MFAAAAALFVLLLLSAVPTFAADRTSLSQLLPNRKIIQTAPVGLPTSGGLARLIKGVGLVPQLPTPSARNIGAVLPTSGGDSFPRVIKKVGAALPSAGSGSLPKALKRAGAVLPSAGDLLGTGRLPKLFVGADDVLPTVVSKGLPVTGNGRLSAKLPKLLENANITLRVPAGNVPARSALDAGLSSLGSGIAGGLTGGATGALAFPGKDRKSVV